MPRQTIPMQCQNCGRTFPGYIRPDKPRKFCSWACRDEVRRDGKLSDLSSMWLGVLSEAVSRGLVPGARSVLLDALLRRVGSGCGQGERRIPTSVPRDQQGERVAGAEPGHGFGAGRALAVTVAGLVRGFWFTMWCRGNQDRRTRMRWTICGRCAPDATNRLTRIYGALLCPHSRTRVAAGGDVPPVKRRGAGRVRAHVTTVIHKLRHRSILFANLRVVPRPFAHRVQIEKPASRFAKHHQLGSGGTELVAQGPDWRVGPYPPDYVPEPPPGGCAAREGVVAVHHGETEGFGDEGKGLGERPSAAAVRRTRISYITVCLYRWPGRSSSA